MATTEEIINIEWPSPMNRGKRQSVLKENKNVGTDFSLNHNLLSGLF